MPTTTQDPNTGAVFFHKTPAEKRMKEALKAAAKVETLKLENNQKMARMEKLLDLIIENLPKASKEKVLEKMKEL